MKFLCEHCKAKYQIADDKVAGRTVRMKCRKCGGSIEVRASVTETSVAMKAGDLAPGDPQQQARAAPLATSLSARAPAPRPAAHNERALAGAFQRSVSHESEPAGLDLRELSAADEWYVAVNGVPVGPVRIGEVRRKAAMGAVTEDSLCWQEGMEEWRAIRTVTELAAVVREAAAGGRASLLPSEQRQTPAPRTAPPRPAQGPSPAARPQSSPAAPAWSRPAAAPSHFETIAGAEADDEGAPTIVGRSPLLDAELERPAAGPSPVNGGSNGAAADPFRPAQDPFKPAVAPFAARAPQPFAPQGAPFAPQGAPFAPQGAPYAPAVAPQVAPPYAPAATNGAYGPQGYPAQPAVSPPIVVPQASRRGNPIAIGMIVMFGCFGMAAAYFIFAAPRAAPTPGAPGAVASSAPAAQTGSVATTAPAPTDIPSPQPVTSAPVAAAAPDAGPRVASTTPRNGNPAGGTTPGAPPSGGTKPGPAAATDPALRDLINGASTGPSAGPAAGGGGGAGAQLTEDETKAVVSQHSLAIRRTCWDRSSTTTPSVNVTVHIVVAGSGQVTQATATGNDPVVAHCLEEEVKRWHWPGGGEVNVPFHFLRQ